MNIFLVRDEHGRERWVAYEDDIAEQVYVYVANTEAFHRNDSVGVDFYYDQRLSYEPDRRRDRVGQDPRGSRPHR